MDEKLRSKDFTFLIVDHTEDEEAKCRQALHDATYGVLCRKNGAAGEPILDCFVRYRYQKTVLKMRKLLGENAIICRREETQSVVKAIENCKEDAVSIEEFGDQPDRYKRYVTSDRSTIHKARSTVQHAVPVAAEVVQSETINALQQPAVVPPPPTTDRDLVIMLIRENSELKNLMIEQQSKLLEAVLSNNYHQNTLCNGSHNVVNSDNSVSTNINHNNNSHNKTFNLNVFLNETCKNAMNMSEFVDSINLELADLMRVGELGFVDGISDIILKNLRALEITERPIHCTDKKRETFYVKDDNRWEKETPENQKIKAVISRVANKNYRLVDEYKRSHPDCHRSHSIYCDQYNKIIVEATGGDLDIPRDVKDKRIIHKISKEVGVHDSSSA